MSTENIKQLIQEKFAFTTDMKKLTKKADDPTEGKAPQKSAHPLEKFREFIKLALGATTTEQDGQLENLVDLNSVIRLANKYALSGEVITNLKNIQAEFDKPKTKRDYEVVAKLWDSTKDSIPYWFLTLMPNNKKEEMTEKDKLDVTNLFNYMAHFNKQSEKAGKELAKDTEHATTDTAAKKNLDKARKDAGIEINKQKTEKPESLDNDAKAKKPEVPEKEKDITAVVL